MSGTCLHCDCSCDQGDAPTSVCSFCEKIDESRLMQKLECCGKCVCHECFHTNIDQKNVDAGQGFVVQRFVCRDPVCQEKFPDIADSFAADAAAEEYQNRVNENAFRGANPDV